MKRAAKERKHRTQALMGATRLASGKDVAIYLVEFVSSSFLYPDARRVALSLQQLSGAAANL